MPESSSPAAARKRHNLNYCAGFIGADANRRGDAELAEVASDIAASADLVSELRQLMRDNLHRAAHSLSHGEMTSDDWRHLVSAWERRLSEVA